MDNVTRTIYGAFVQACQFNGAPFTALPNTTLNQKFNVLPDQHTSGNIVPDLKYFGIGIGGITMELGVGGTYIPTPIIFAPDQASLYKPIPFLIRPLNQDVAANVRANYRMRAIVTYNNIQYVAYYLKLLPSSTASPQIQLMNVNNGVQNSYPYTPSVDVLNPTPPTVNAQTQNVTVANYLSVSNQLALALTADDIVEIQNACSIIYGDPNYAVISELALCTGVDYAATATINGVSTGYDEAIDVQVSSYIQDMFALQFSNSEIDLVLDIGSTEPLLVLS